METQMNILKNISYDKNKVPPSQKWKKLTAYYKPYKGVFFVFVD